MHIGRKFAAIGALALGFCLPGCGDRAQVAGPGDIASPKSSLILYRNARIYTMNPASPWADAFTVDGGRIIAVGSEETLAARAESAAEIIDLDGNFVMPGLIDAHVHPIWGGNNALFACNFPFSATPDDIQRAIGDCVAAQPEAEWIHGGQWTSNFFVDNTIPVPREFLDAVSGDKAVILTDDSGHNRWVNSRALELIGITQDTPDPAGGAIWRDAEGNPTGVLMEAYKEIRARVPPYDAAQHVEGARYAVRRANAYGITGLKDAAASESEVAAYHALDRNGELTLYAATSLILRDDDYADGADLAGLAALRDEDPTPRVLTGFVKIFLDGVPTASRTAAMLDPYMPNEEHGSDFRGALHLPPEQLSAALTALDGAGYTVKIHTAGDRAVRVALDAIAAARAANGNSGLRHELAHAGYIAQSDIPRFTELNVVADFSPFIWSPSPIIDSVVGAVGERGKRYWPARDLLDAGASMLVGSDWPSAVPSINPWTGLESLVTRRDAEGTYPGALWPEQAITLPEALRLLTIAGARALRIEDVTGSIEPGKSADFIVIDRNLLDIPPQEISDVQVLGTYFQGQRVFTAGE